MVREIKKTKKGLDALDEFESITSKEVDEISKKKEKDFSDELDSGFFFSVVFDTKEERDIWLSKRKIKLVEDMFVKACDLSL